MSVYTLNLRVFWPLFTCVLTGLVVLHHIAHRLTPEEASGPEPAGYEAEAEEEGCSSHRGPPVLLSLAKLLLAIALCYFFIRYCSNNPSRAGKGTLLGPNDGLPKSSTSRRELLDDYYARWVRLSPHVVGHSKANVAKLVGDLVKAGRTDVPPESTLAFRGDFLQVGSSYEEHKVGSPDCFDILVPLRVPRGLKLEPRLIWAEGPAEEKTENRNAAEKEKGQSKGEAKMTATKVIRRRSSKRHSGGKGNAAEKTTDNVVEEKEVTPKEEATLRREEDGKNEEEVWGPPPQCSMEVPRREEWVRKHRAFADTFLRLHPQGSSPGSGAGAMGSRAYRFTPESVHRWFYSAVQRSLASVRYPHEQRCTLNLALVDERVQLRLTPRSDYVCCHISMAIRLLPALPLGDGLYLVPTDSVSVPNAPAKTKSLDDKDLWTLYFPRQEQRLLSWVKTRLPQGSCHLKCLQLIKAIRNLGGQALDTQGAALWRSVLSSYVVKTAWLRLLLSTPPDIWEEAHLVARVEDLIRSLRELLQKRTLTHLFLGGESSTSVLPDSVVLPKLVKEAAGVDRVGLGGNLWAGIPPASLDLVSGRLAYAWTHLHRLIRLTRPQRSSIGLGRVGHGHCQHLEMD